MVAPMLEKIPGENPAYNQLFKCEGETSGLKYLGDQV
jgi:hypothetical protein